MKRNYDSLFLLLLCLVSLLPVSYSQTCSMQVSAEKICAGSTVIFTATFTGDTPVSYSWNYGDGFYGVDDTATHTYITPGNYSPGLKVRFASGDSCTATYPLIRVFALPVAGFTITTSDTMCYKGNELCIVDQSTSGPSNAPIFKRIYQLSNGHLQTDLAPYPPVICYKDSVDFANGHLFSLVVEVTDTNNCVSRVRKEDSVLLYKKIDIGIVAKYSLSCFNTPVTFENISSLSPSEVKKFYWVFGDGGIDSSDWDGSVHNYSGRDSALPYLVVTTNDNCTDTVPWTTPVVNIIPDTLIYFDTMPNRCYSGHTYVFASNNDPLYTTTSWKFFDVSGQEVIPDILKQSPTDIMVRFPTCGVYRVQMFNQFPDCYTLSDSVFIVYGPKAIMEVEPIRITNRDQCHAQDTVHFVTPNPYLSCQSWNTNMIHIWDFGDPYAPACTTDTRNGINMGVNCNFSKDTFNVWHYYTPGLDECYKASLYMEDPLLGCKDSDTSSIALKPPSAHWDSTVTPVRRGLYYVGMPCIGSIIQFMFDETLPVCGYEKLWLNLDSACDKSRWMLVDDGDIARMFLHTYDSTCDQADGYVTIGMIVKNGNCFDTAWYHRKLQLRPINPFIQLSAEPGCHPYIIKAVPKDSIQYDLDNVRWDLKIKWFKDLSDLRSNKPIEIDPDTFPRWQYFTFPDSVIQPQFYTDTLKGIYQYSLSIRNKLQCSRTDNASIGVGYFDDFEVIRDANVLCVNDTITLQDFIRYYNSTAFQGIDSRNFWADTARASAGLEQVWWDIGDGKGFSYTGSHPVVKFEKPGKYTVTMVVKDSTGCYDTIIKPDYINVTAVNANIATLEDNYFCAPQIVAFRDSSFAIDSVGASNPSVFDHITSWSWNFGDNTPVSLLINPAHNYTKNGVFHTVLTVTTRLGCIGHDTAGVSLKGPLPSFTIEDTMQCAPFNVTFHNTTGRQLKNWTWYFGDQNNQTVTVTHDSDIHFTYTTPGIYSVKMIAIEELFNPSTGNTIICSASFPDSVTQLPTRDVYVLPIWPVSILARDTICLNEEVQFTALSHPGYSGFNWTFGDGGSAIHNRPDTSISHVYTGLGIHKVLLVPFVSTGYECVDSATANVFVSGIEAGFKIDTIEPSRFEFTNESQYAVRYLWDFGQPNLGTANFSADENSSFDFGEDTGTFIICLTVFNSEDCSDSVCKPLKLSRLDERIIIPNVFTPDNNDGKNDAFDIDILGFTQYHLLIYNRWGTEVYDSKEDGIGNDGINWNGKDHNIGEPCSEGVYFFIFDYQLYSHPNLRTVHGTITLIRDK